MKKNLPSWPRPGARTTGPSFDSTNSRITGVSFGTLIRALASPPNGESTRNTRPTVRSPPAAATTHPTRGTGRSAPDIDSARGRAAEPGAEMTGDALDRTQQEQGDPENANRLAHPDQ